MLGRSRREKNSPGGSHCPLTIAPCRHRFVHEETKAGPCCTNCKYWRVQLPWSEALLFTFTLSWLPRMGHSAANNLSRARRPGNTRHPRSSPRPPRSWPPIRPPCNCGCCRPSSWSPPRKQHPGHARPGRIAALSSTAPPRPQPGRRHPGHRRLAAGRARYTRPPGPASTALTAPPPKHQPPSDRCHTRFPPQPSCGGNRQPRVPGTAVNRHCPDRTSAAFGVMFMVKVGKLAAGPRPRLAAEAGRRP